MPSEGADQWPNSSPPPNIAAPDEVYAELIAAHEGFSKEQSDAFNAQLSLILMNHLGDIDILRQALTAVAPTTKETD